MIKLVKDVVLGEPILAVTIISLVLTSWLGALTQVGDEVPLWLAIAAPAAIALGGFYARQTSSADYSKAIEAADEEE